MSKLLDQLRAKIRLKHYAIRTEEAYVQWRNPPNLFHQFGQRPAGLEDLEGGDGVVDVGHKVADEGSTLVFVSNFRVQQPGKSLWG